MINTCVFQKLNRVGWRCGCDRRSWVDYGCIILCVLGRSVTSALLTIGTTHRWVDLNRSSDNNRLVVATRSQPVWRVWNFATNRDISAISVRLARWSTESDSLARYFDVLSNGRWLQTERSDMVDDAVDQSGSIPEFGGGFIDAKGRKFFVHFWNAILIRSSAGLMPELKERSQSGWQS